MFLHLVLHNTQGMIVPLPPVSQLIRRIDFTITPAFSPLDGLPIIFPFWGVEDQLFYPPDPFLPCQRGPHHAPHLLSASDPLRGPRRHQRSG
jgi:hypothetical protein